MFNNHENVRVVELGAGVGLTSLVCSLFTKRIMCTDLENIVKLAENNYKTNKIECSEEILFKKIDWKNYENILNRSQSCSCSNYELDESDIAYIESSNVFLAADVVYDDELTINFLNLLCRLMSCKTNQPKCAFIALEKRMNFEVTSLDVGSSCYDYFCESMKELNEYSNEGIQFKTEILDLETLPKYMISYDRSEYLVIWKVTTTTTE